MFSKKARSSSKVILRTDCSMSKRGREGQCCIGKRARSNGKCFGRERLLSGKVVWSTSPHVVCKGGDGLRPSPWREEGDDACHESGSEIVRRLLEASRCPRLQRFLLVGLRIASGQDNQGDIRQRITVLQPLQNREAIPGGQIEVENDERGCSFCRRQSRNS